ncbi:hypothetical protein [Geodermatophilus sp. SYSU D00815]
MQETQREPRAAAGAVAEQTDESRPQETSALPTARLLANPRRIRRN